MATVRKGLSLHNNVVEHFPQEGSKFPSKKLSSLSKPATLKKPECKMPFSIYRDTVESPCRFCGSVVLDTDKSLTRKSPEVVSTEVQTSDADIKEWLCGANPPENYWEELAERRRVALKETLDENRELCDLVDALNKELERLSRIEEQAKHFAQMYSLFTKEAEQV
ncbi:unnamed protein product [Dicrocoelium dendriticum]|nr:unnamed protein product [Dicrocoelium dendriticum]